MKDEGKVTRTWKESNILAKPKVQKKIITLLAVLGK